MRRELTWMAHAKFMHGVSGVIFDGDGRVLLLKHRFWKGQRWGLPGGLAKYGETLGATLRREMMEEAGLEVRPVKLMRVKTTGGRLAEFIVLAEAAGVPVARSPEILEARFWDIGGLPENMLGAHRELLGEMAGLVEREGLGVE
jgi:8-oxo-dGTP diphosphatase